MSGLCFGFRTRTCWRTVRICDVGRALHVSLFPHEVPRSLPRPSDVPLSQALTSQGECTGLWLRVRACVCVCLTVRVHLYVCEGLGFLRDFAPNRAG